MKLFSIVRNIFNIPFVKFLFVGGINALFGYLIFSLTVFVLKNVYVSVVVATIIAVLFNFKTYGTLVFQSKDDKKIFKFFGVYLITMLIQMGLLRLLATLGLTNPYIAGALLLLPMALFSYLLNRTFVFKN